MCLSLAEIKAEKLAATKGKPHSHQHAKSDAAKIKELHKQERATQTVEHEHAELVNVGSR